MQAKYEEGDVAHKQPISTDEALRVSSKICIQHAATRKKRVLCTSNTWGNFRHLESKSGMFKPN